MMHTWTRRLAACLLLFGMSLTVPAVAGPMHICVTEWLKTEIAEDDCCNHGSSCCDPEQPLESPCCVDIDDLPDASAPGSPQLAPEPPVTDLGWSTNLPQAHAQESKELSWERPDRIRGPCEPSTHRALLEIWRL